MTLITVTPGPVMKVYSEGVLVAEKKLERIESLRIIESLSRELRVEHEH